MQQPVHVQGLQEDASLMQQAWDGLLNLLNGMDALLHLLYFALLVGVLL